MAEALNARVSRTAVARAHVEPGRGARLAADRSADAAVAGRLSSAAVSPAAHPPRPEKEEARHAVPGRPSLEESTGSERGRDSDQLSTSTQAQFDRILKALAAGRHNTFELRQLGVMQVSARIWDLRAMGYQIVTVGRVIARDEHARVAVYSVANVVETLQ